MADLGEFLAESASRTREPTVWDCAAMPAAWAVRCGFPDPMRAWRDAYATEHEGEQLALDAGGLQVLFARGMAEAGVPQAAAPWQPGDLAVVSLLGRQAGAIFTGKRWGFVGVRGLAFASLTDDCVVQAWGPSRRG